MTYGQMVAGYVAVAVLIAVVLLAVELLSTLSGSGERGMGVRPSVPYRGSSEGSMASRSLGPRVLPGQFETCRVTAGSRLPAG